MPGIGPMTGEASLRKDWPNVAVESQFFGGWFSSNYTAKEQYGTKASAKWYCRSDNPITIARGSAHGSSLFVGIDF
jgi:hypothetical protein